MACFLCRVGCNLLCRYIDLLQIGKVCDVGAFEIRTVVALGFGSFGGVCFNLNYMYL